MQQIEVGKPFTGPVPPNDGAILEIGPDGDLVLMIQFKNPTPSEETALKAGFERYSFYEYAGAVTIATWVFKFPAPVGYIDAPFHAGLYKDGRTQKFLQNQGNLLQVYVLDGDIVRSIKAVGLQHEAAAGFRETIRRQLAESVSQDWYNSAIDTLYKLSSEEIFRRGKIYRHGGQA